MKKYLVTLLLIIFSVFILSSCEQNIPQDDIKTYGEIANERSTGELIYIKNDSQSGNKNYEDDIYSYWFDKDGKLLSRTQLIRSNDKNTLSAEQALQKATDELTKYTKEQDFGDDGWEITVSKISKADDSWFIEYAFLDDKNILTQKHTVTIDKNSDASFITLSSEKKSEDAVIIDEKTAIDTAVDAIVADINTQENTSLTKDELISNGTLYISEKELFALKGDTLWQITAENVNAVKNEPYAYFVQIDATTGEVKQVDICK